MDSAYFHKFSVQVKAVLYGDFLISLMRIIEDLLDHVSRILSIYWQSTFQENDERIDAQYLWGPLKAFLDLFGQLHHSFAQLDKVVEFPRL